MRSAALPRMTAYPRRTLLDALCGHRRSVKSCGSEQILTQGCDRNGLPDVRPDRSLHVSAGAYDLGAARVSDAMSIKVCRKCGKEKDRSDFYDQGRGDGKQPNCKKCKNAYGKAWREKKTVVDKTLGELLDGWMP